MLSVRIIPCLDVKDGQVVKGVNFENLQQAGDPVEHATFYDREGADEIVFLDITASAERRGTILDVVRRTAESIFLPLTIGGGVRDCSDIYNLLRAGADKVSLNTRAVTHPDLVDEAARRFGSQCVVVAIDARRSETPGRWTVYTHGGRTATGLEAVDWAAQVCDRGAGEILLTSMDADGTKNGYDIELTRRIADRVRVPVIASGGAGTLEHFYEVLSRGGAHAVLAASLFHYRTMSIRQVKTYLQQKGIPVRL